MSMINEIMQRVYDSSEFAIKGYSLSLKDTFFVTHSTRAYVVRQQIQILRLGNHGRGNNRQGA